MLIELVNDFLGYLVVGSSFLPTISIILSRQKINLIIKAYSFEILIINILNLLLYKFTSVNQNVLFLSHSLIEFSFVLFILKGWTTFSYRYKRILHFIFSVNITFFFFVITKYTPEIGFGIYGLFCKIVLSGLSIATIFERYFKSEKDSLINDAPFIFASGLIIYNGIQIYIMIFDSIIREDLSQLFFFIWPIMQLGTIIFHFLIARSIWKLTN